MLKIKRIETKNLLYYEALFNGGNLYAFTISDLVNQLATIYGFKTLLNIFNLNQNEVSKQTKGGLLGCNCSNK